MAFAALFDQLAVTSRDVSNGGHYMLLAIANPLYLAGIVAGVFAALWAVARYRDIVSLTAALFGIVAVSQSYGDHWSYTRATAPMFALLAYIALTRSHPRIFVPIACSAALLPLYPA